MKIFFAVFLTFFTLELFAYNVKEIKYEGLVHLSESVALRMLDFQVGQEVGDAEIDKAIKSYFAQGYFDDIYVTFENDVLRFHFKQKPIITKVELKGWKENDEDVHESVIQIKKGTLYDERKLQAAKKRIVEAISQDGKIDSVVEIEKEYLENGSMKVTFLVNEGEKIIIEKLRYTGVEGLDSSEFDDVIANKEHQFMGWFWGRNDGKMSLADLSYDHLRIRDYYMQKGYLDAKVNEPFVRVNFDHYKAFMSYEIQEGDVYTINEVVIDQLEEEIDPKEFEELLGLKVGEAFNITTFREDSEKIKTIVADHGYAFVQVSPDLQKNTEDQTVKVIFKVSSGKKVRIRDVIISGNTRTLDRIIRRELYLGPGDMYSLTDLKDSRNSLGRLGFFDGNTIEEKRVDNETIDLVVKVKEAPTGNIQLGGGYGSYGGILLSIAVDDRNIWGSGINVGVRAERSQMNETYSFSISNNRLNDSDFSGNFSIYSSSYDYGSYTVNSQGINLGTGHRFTRYISGYLGYSYSENTYEMFEDFDSSLYRYYLFEDFDKSSVSVSARYDSTDDYYLPREGIAFSQSFEKAGLGATADFFKLRSNFGKYIGLEEFLGFDAILRYKAKYNMIIDTGFVPIAERFYLGGIGSVRGYESYSISPRDPNDEDRRIGGTQSFSNSLEVSFPLVPKAKMRLVTFVDWGFIGEDKLDEYSRGGYGAGLEWFSPVGPIQLMFARPLNKETGDRTSSFEFTMGQRF